MVNADQKKKIEKYKIVIDVTMYHVTEKYNNIRPSEVD